MRFLTVAMSKSGDSGLFGFPEARVAGDSIAADWVWLMDGVGVCLVEVVAAVELVCGVLAVLRLSRQLRSGLFPGLGLRLRAGLWLRLRWLLLRRARFLHLPRLLLRLRNLPPATGCSRRRFGS